MNLILNKRNKKLRYCCVGILLIGFLFVNNAFAQNNEMLQDKIFKAEVVEILEQRENILGDGTNVFQQNLKLRGLKGEFKDKDIEFAGIDEYDVINKNLYKVGDKVLVVASLNFEGNTYYYITDYVRSSSLLLLSIIFILVLIIIGRLKGFRSIFSLVISFFVIIKYIIPKILAGANPISITIVGSAIIVLIIIYLTEGFQKKSHIVVVSIFISLFITIFLSWFFVNLAKITGMSSEEMSYIVNIGAHAINFKGLLLAGIVIGSIGILDDVIVSQVSIVEQIYIIDKTQSFREVFKKANEIGMSHISSMVNTLFLAYAGVSLPLLILFVSGQSVFLSWTQVINNEIIAIEIIRTLAGSIGLILAVPISTILAVVSFKK